MLGRIKQYIPLKVKIHLNWIRNFLFDRQEYDYMRQWLPKKACNGKEYPDKVFFVIRNKERATGLLSCYLSMLGHLPRAERDGLIPIFDMQSHLYTMVTDPSEEGKDINGWEHFFRQPTEYGMNDIRCAKNVEYSRGLTGKHDKVFFDNTAIDKDFVHRWMYYDEKYIYLQKTLQDRFAAKAHELLDGKRVLGTMIREDYIVLAKAGSMEVYHDGIASRKKFAGHPVQPALDELRDNLAQKMEDWHCDYLYVVAETSFVMEYLENAFSGKVLSTGRKRRAVTELNVDDYRASKKEFEKDYPVLVSNADYLEEVYVLSQCNSLCAAKCSGSIVAALWNRNRYEHLEIIQKGVY